MTRVLVVFAAGVVAIAVGVVAVMDDRETRIAGTNQIKLVDHPVTTEGGRAACKGFGTVPGGTAGVEVGSGP